MKFLSKGLLENIHDGGRFGYASTGITKGGVMDTFSWRILNILLGNPENNPVVELHFPAPLIQFEENCCFAIYGAEFSPKLNGCDILTGKIYKVKKDDILSFSKMVSGQRCYLGVKGIFNLENWLGSYSYNSLVKMPESKSVLTIICGGEENIIKQGIRPLTYPKTIRYVADFEYNFLNPDSVELLGKEMYEISVSSNRIGYRLKGEALSLKNKVETISSATDFGTIQLLPNGQMIILMVDAPTTGGYPKLGFVIKSDLKILSQLGPGDKFLFKKVSFNEAIKAIKDDEKWLLQFKTSINYYANRY